MCIRDRCIAANAATNDYGIYTRVGNGAAYGLGVYDHTNSTWRFRVSGGGGVFAQNTTLQSISDQRLKENKKLNVGFLFAILLWPKIYLKSGISKRINYKSFYRTMAAVMQKQQNITAVPRRYSSFIRDVWMNQIRFNKIGKKSINFTNNVRFRASYDFLLLRNPIEKNLETPINWWTEFKAANYDKKMKLLNEYRKGGNEKR